MITLASLLTVDKNHRSHLLLNGVFKCFYILYSTKRCKSSYPVQLAEYAISNTITNKHVFVQWNYIPSRKTTLSSPKLIRFAERLHISMVYVCQQLIPVAK